MLTVLVLLLLLLWVLVVKPTDLGGEGLVPAERPFPFRPAVRHDGGGFVLERGRGLEGATHRFAYQGLVWLCSW